MTIKFSNGGILVKRISEIPTSFVGAAEVILDVETSSGDPKQMSVNPWRFCKMLGFGITVKGCKEAYFAHARYTEDFWGNGPQFVQDMLWYAQTWINHHIKYDMHVLTNHFGIQFPDHLKFRCTIVSARLIDSDRGGARGGYALDALSLNWLKHDISTYEERLQPYLGRANKDYGSIPADILAEYGCEDVLVDSRLDDYIQARMPERCKNVAATEIELTRHLFQLEQNGMHFNTLDMQLAQFESLNQMHQLDGELAQLTGMNFRPAVNDDCNEVLCGHYGLPIVAYTKDSEGEDTDNASFDKKALATYKAMPFAPQDVVSRIIEYRRHNQRNNLFFTPLLESGWDGCLHPTYGQNNARTGRMTCADPNAQQLDDIISGLIIPPPGWSMISSDASQIELRLIMHYVQDAGAIAAYRANPDTDFHQMTADEGDIDRKLAKTVNFGVGFGEGEKKLIRTLMADENIIAAVKADVAATGETDPEKRDALFEVMAYARCKAVYVRYHARFSTIKPTTKAVEAKVKSVERRLGTAIDSRHCYGYVTNLYGRDRHLPYAKYRSDFKTKDPYDKAWLGFSTLNQSTAADLMKERFVAVMQMIGKLPIKPIGIVHDELLWIAPTEIANDPRTLRDIVGVLELPSVKISVPIRWSIGVSVKNWLDAATPVKDGGKSAMLQYKKEECQNLEWLR